MGEGLYYQGQWQELVVMPDPEAEKWVIALLIQK